MMHNISYEHSRSKIRTLHPKIIGKIYLELNYANLVIKNNKSYTNCGIIAVVLGIILSKIDKCLSIAQSQKQNKEKLGIIHQGLTTSLDLPLLSFDRF